jgi:predicted flap endonuclease-1-like 5' DNA nuclease
MINQEETNMTKLTDVEGIGETYAAKLIECGCATQEALLKMGGQPAGRKQLITDTGISDKLILKWINRADLARIKGVGGEYADLLEASGVDTVPELAQRNAANLHAKMAEVNDSKKLVRSLPTESAVAGWVDQAIGLDRAIFY